MKKKEFTIIKNACVERLFCQRQHRILQSAPGASFLHPSPPDQSRKMQMNRGRSDACARKGVQKLPEFILALQIILVSVSFPNILENDDISRKACITEPKLIRFVCMKGRGQCVLSFLTLYTTVPILYYLLPFILL